MKKVSQLVVYLLFLFATGSVIAQDKLKVAEKKVTIKDSKNFNIVTLDGKKETIKIIPDYASHLLLIKCLKDEIMIDDFWGVSPVVKVLNKNFIEIDYEVRGGSNLGLGNTLLICVSGSKLYEAMHVLRYTQWESGDLKTDYLIKPVLEGTDKNNYKLKVFVHDQVKSTPQPDQNYNYNNQSTITFDSRRNIFYSIKETMGDLTIKAKLVKQKVTDPVPIIMLGKRSYYFIDNKWYQMAISNKMEEFKQFPPKDATPPAAASVPTYSSHTAQTNANTNAAELQTTTQHLTAGRGATIPKIES